LVTIKIKWPGFNVLFAVGLILFFIAFALMWAYVLMPICEARDWKPPCPPHPHESVGPGG
jgi:hypothetical protein